MLYNNINKKDGDWGLGIGDWGFGDWAQSPIPKPQTPIPNPHIDTIKKQNKIKKFIRKYLKMFMK